MLDNNCHFLAIQVLHEMFAVCNFLNRGVVFVLGALLDCVGGAHLVISIFNELTAIINFPE